MKNAMIWWLLPGVLGGMSMPFIAAARRMEGSGTLDSFDDELPALQAAGVRAVVSLLNIPSDQSVYESAGFSFLCLPIADGAAPDFAMVERFVLFVGNHRVANLPVAVHCEAGCGRTGTMLASYLIWQGAPAEAAIKSVRKVEPAAIETSRQIRFLAELEMRLRHQRAG